MSIFVASLVALLLGPLLHRWVRGRPSLASALDAFVVLAVLVMVLGEVAPLAFEGAGIAGLAMFVLGLAAPYVADRMFGISHSHRWANWIVVGGVVVHALADGIALSSLRGLAGHGLGLGLALLLHRIPVGLGIWLLAPSSEPASGAGGLWSKRRNAILMIAAVAIATGIGQLWGKPALGWLGIQAEVFSAFAAGMLVHVVAHAPSTAATHSDERKWRDHLIALGACVGAALLWVGLHHTGEGHGGHGEHVHHAHPGWIFWFVIPGLVSGIRVKGARASSFLVASAASFALLIGLTFGFWWGIGAAILAWFVVNRQGLNSRVPVQPDPKALRAVALSGWVGGWIFALGHHAHFEGLGPELESIMVLGVAIVLMAMRPGLLLMTFPLVGALRVVPTWVVGALFAETLWRTWRGQVSEHQRMPRFVAASIGAVAGFAAQEPLRTWSFELREIESPTLLVAMAAAAGLYLWLSAAVGVRRWLAGGEFHQHDHP